MMAISIIISLLLGIALVMLGAALALGVRDQSSHSDNQAAIGVAVIFMGAILIIATLVGGK